MDMLYAVKVCWLTFRAFQEMFTAMTLKLQEVANFGMFFPVMQTFNFIHVCQYDKNKDTPFCIGSIVDG